jgi:hypothetical protein
MIDLNQSQLLIIQELCSCELTRIKVGKRVRPREIQAIRETYDQVTEMLNSKNIYVK